MAKAVDHALLACEHGDLLSEADTDAIWAMAAADADAEVSTDAGRSAGASLSMGSAKLSALAQKSGWRVAAVDWKGNRHTPAVPPVLLDLADAQRHATLWTLLRDADLKHVHISPPCATFMP